MALTEQNDTWYAGNRRKLSYVVENQDSPGTRLNLTGLTFVWSLSAMRGDGSFEQTPFLEKTSASGITVTSAVNGELDVDVTGADCTGLAGDYYAELEAFDGDGNGLVLATGVMTLRRNVARITP